MAVPPRDVLALNLAAFEGNLDRIRSLLTSKPSLINIKSDGEITPLYAAVENNQIEASNFLLSRGADPNIGFSDGLKPLHVAAGNGNTRLVELLL